MTTRGRPKKGGLKLTKGMLLLRKFRDEIEAQEEMDAPHVTEAEEMLRLAVEFGGSALLREMADAIDAEREHITLAGPERHALALAETYIHACRTGRKIGGGGRFVPTESAFLMLVDAVRQGPFTPTPAQVHAYVCKCMEEPPDPRTVTRWLKTILAGPPRIQRVRRDPTI